MLGLSIIIQWKSLESTRTNRWLPQENFSSLPWFTWMDRHATSCAHWGPTPASNILRQAAVQPQGDRFTHELESTLERGQVHTLVWKQLRKGDRFAHQFGSSSQKGTGSHMGLESAQKRGQVHTQLWGEGWEGNRFTHWFGNSSEKGTGSHISLEAAHKTPFVLFAHDCWLICTVSGNHQWICFLDVATWHFLQLFFLSRS